MMLTPTLRLLLGLLTAVGCGVSWSNADTQALDFDFSPLSLGTAQHNRIERPTVTWEASSAPFSRCTQLITDDQQQKRYSTACVVWSEKQQRCHIVTLSRTSHAQLGHLLVACMRRAT